MLLFGTILNLFFLIFFLGFLVLAIFSVLVSFWVLLFRFLIVWTVIWSYGMRTPVVVVWVHFFVLSVIFLMMRESLWLVMVFLIFLLMSAWICLVNFHGGMILVSDALMIVEMLMLLTLCLHVVFVGE